MQAAAVGMAVVAADDAKLLLHWAAVRTTDGGAYQLRRFAFAVAFPVASRPDGQSEGGLLRGTQRRRIGRISFGLISFGQIGPEPIGFD